MTKRVRAKVTGRVQGVWFRASTQQKAAELGVRGYVRNMPDGSVEFVAVGPPEKVDELVEWARVGPPMARVERVELKEYEGPEDFDGFRIRY